jgi:hypothetical protein
MRRSGVRLLSSAPPVVEGWIINRFKALISLEIQGFFVAIDPSVNNLPHPFMGVSMGG